MPARSFVGLNHPEAVAGAKAEALGAVVHGDRVGRSCCEGPFVSVPGDACSRRYGRWGCLLIPVIPYTQSGVFGHCVRRPRSGRRSERRSPEVTSFGDDRCGQESGVGTRAVGGV